MKAVSLSEIKDDLSRFLREAEKQEIVITRHGRPAGVLIGFKSEEDWFEYRLENDPRFLQRIDRARQNLRDGRGIKLEGLPTPLRIFAQWNPVSSVTQAARHLFGNTVPGAPVPDVFPLQHPVEYSLIWAAAILAVFVPLTVVMYKRAAAR